MVSGKHGDAMESISGVSILRVVDGLMFCDDCKVGVPTGDLVEVSADDWKADDYTFTVTWKRVTLDTTE